MRILPKTLLSTVAFLLLQSHGASASDAEFRSFGQVTSCQNNLPANATRLDMSIFPENNTLTFSFSGLPTIPGNATLSIAVEADGDEVYRTQTDPCSVGIPDLCPAAGGVASFSNASMNIPADKLDRMDLPSRADVKGRLSLQTYDEYGRFHSSCFQTALRSDASNDGNGTSIVEGSGSGNETAGSEDGSSTNGTTDEGGNDTSGTTQDSGASTLQGIGYFTM